MKGQNFRLQAVALVAAFLLTATNDAYAGAPVACHGDDEAAVVCLVNEARAAMGLSELYPLTTLTTAAERYARRMAMEGFFSHTDPAGEGPSERIGDSGYGGKHGRSWAAGENLGRGTGVYSTPSSIVFAWLASPSHRKILLGRWRHVGVGIADGTYVLYAGRR